MLDEYFEPVGQLCFDSSGQDPSCSSSSNTSFSLIYIPSYGASALVAGFDSMGNAIAISVDTSSFELVLVDVPDPEPAILWGICLSSFGVPPAPPLLTPPPTPPPKPTLTTTARPPHHNNNNNNSRPNNPFSFWQFLMWLLSLFG